MWVISKNSLCGVVENKSYKLIKELKRTLNGYPGDTWYLIIDDLGRQTYYTSNFFYKKSEKREIILNKLLNL